MQQELKKIEIINGLMNMTQAAAYLNVKTSTLYGMVMRRQIGVVKIGRLNRFRPQDLEQWIQEHLQEARPNPLLPAGGAVV